MKYYFTLTRWRKPLRTKLHKAAVVLINYENNRLIAECDYNSYKKDLIKRLNDLRDYVLKTHPRSPTYKITTKIYPGSAEEYDSGRPTYERHEIIEINPICCFEIYPAKNEL